MTIRDFFKDKHGKVVLYQAPNLLLSGWLALTVVDLIFLHGKYQPVRVLTTAFLFAWAYDELRRGDSPFRKALGGVVLAGVIVMIFIKW